MTLQGGNLEEQECWGEALAWQPLGSNVYPWDLGSFPHVFLSRCRPQKLADELAAEAR